MDDKKLKKANILKKLLDENTFDNMFKLKSSNWSIYDFPEIHEYFTEFEIECKKLVKSLYKKLKKEYEEL